MGRHITKTLATVTLTATSSAIFDMDLDTVENLQVLVDATYAATNNPTGITIDLKGGFGGADLTSVSDPFPYGVTTDGSSPTTVPVFSDNVETVTPVVVPPGQVGSTRRKTFFYLNEIGRSWPRWIRMVIYNRDPSNSCIIVVRLDL